MKPSELLGKAIEGNVEAVRELGRLLDSLLRLAGPGTYATQQTAGLVRLASDGETTPGAVVQGNDSRLVVMASVKLLDANGSTIEYLFPLEVIDERAMELFKEMLIEQRKTRIALEILIGSQIDLETIDLQAGG